MDFFAKLIYIPFFVLMFFMGLVFGLMTFIPVPFMVLFGPAMVIFVVIIDVIFMLCGSIYGVGAVIRLRSEGVISNAETVFYSIMQVIFCLDVVAAIIMYVKARRADQMRHAVNKPM